MQLVKGWRTWPRQWSTWLVGAGSLISFVPELAEVLRNVWEFTPMDIRASYPLEWTRGAGIAITLLSVPAKLIRQRKLYESELAKGPEDDRARGR